MFKKLTVLLFMVIFVLQPLIPIIIFAYEYDSQEKEVTEYIRFEIYLDEDTSEQVSNVLPTEDNFNSTEVKDSNVVELFITESGDESQLLQISTRNSTIAWNQIPNMTIGTWANNPRVLYMGEHNGHPLRWRVLEVGSDRTALLILDDVLRTESGTPDVKQMCTETDFSGICVGTPILPNFLRDEFPLLAFTAAERDSLLMRTVHIPNSLADTPSVLQLQNPNFFANDSDRALSATFWGSHLDFAMIIGTDGWIPPNPHVITATLFAGVRPTVKINLDAAIFNDSPAEYTVTFVYNYVGRMLDIHTTETTEYDTTIAIPETTPLREGYVFTRWTRDAAGTSEFIFGTDVITENLRLYAQWEAIPAFHTVTFDLHGGLGDFPTQKVENGSLAIAPITIPTRAGYTFIGWFTTEVDGEIFNFDEVAIVVDTLIHARWESQIVVPTPIIHAVTFNLHGGVGDFPTQEVENGSLAIAPTTIPTRAGYTFVGWFTTEVDGKIFNFNETEIITDTIIHARWVHNSVTDQGPNNGTNRPSLPQTGAAVGSSILVGIALGTAGLTVMAKNKRQK